MKQMNQLRAQIAEAYLGMAEVFGRPITKAGLQVFLQAVEDLEPQSVLQALSEAARQSKSFPAIADIRRLANPVEAVTVEQDAIDASNRILQAMTKFGWTNPDRAKEFMGELAWKVVEREGGWQSLCERTGNDDLPVLKAQWRELAKALRARAAAGVLDSAPTLTGIAHESTAIPQLGFDPAKLLKSIPGEG